ncbi:MAG TPA: DUF2975 domain-containing protein [Rhizomicrobium sp.]|nr:DUF2975 domain-containing protein [Rhizomicrobium sp.]
MPGTQHLFTVTRGLLRIAILVCLFLIGLLGLVLGALALSAAGLLHLPIPASEIQGLTMSQILSAASIAVAAGEVGIALIAWMFLLTARIVDTASHGDPFVTENADRLNHIGLLLLAIQVIGLVTDTAMSMFPDKIREHISAGFGGVSATGILAALLIFVLAQIFRRGSEMRAELEGTV